MKSKYQWIRGTEVVLWSLSIGVFIFFLLNILPLPSFVPMMVAIILFCAAMFQGSRYVHLFSLGQNDLALYLNRHYPALQESADLLLIRDEDLSGLQRLQKNRTTYQFEKIYPSIKLPHYLGRAITVFTLSIVISVGLTAFSNSVLKQQNAIPESLKKSDVDKQKLPAAITRSLVKIFPPPYTGIKNYTSANLNLQIPEGSTVEWSMSFNEQVIAPKIVLSTKDTVTLFERENEFTVKYSFLNSGFYHLTWKSSDSMLHSTDYYKIDVIKDHPPIISVNDLPQFLELDANDNLNIAVRATLTDDYSLTQAGIVATVSKGTGEAIKFREEKLVFDAPKKIQGKKVEASRSLNLTALGLQPGDELYFYIEAVDSKIPIPNRARTETYFISLKDTASQVTSVDAALGVDLMPEYFRSQRQIIIDSEKLLKEKKRISKQQFNERSNALAYDQKILRLRYGEFLGEEFESSIGPQPSVGEPEDGDEDVEKKFGHAHDTENEHNLVEEKDHSHNKKESVSGQQEDPAKEYVHAHDSDEEATFFTQSIRAKLKAAITIMWDAELYLRLYQPEQSLPYQYKALKLLKEISQDSRIYVHRTGIDPPPLKEEKRLTGDLAEIQNSTSAIQDKKTESYPNIRAALIEAEKLLHADIVTLSPATMLLFSKAGQELAAIELTQPGGHLETLSLLKQITQDEIKDDELKSALVKIKDSFSKVLPRQTVNPQPRAGLNHALDLEFLKKLEASRQPD